MPGDPVQDAIDRLTIEAAEDRVRGTATLPDKIEGPAPRIPAIVSELASRPESDRAAFVADQEAAGRAEWERTRERTTTERFVTDPIATMGYGVVRAGDAFLKPFAKGADLGVTAAGNILTGQDFSGDQMARIDERNTSLLSKSGGEVVKKATIALPEYAEHIGKIGDVAGSTAAMVVGGRSILPNAAPSLQLAAGAAAADPEHPIEAAASALVFAKVAGFASSHLRGMSESALRRAAAEAVAVYGTDVAMQFVKNGEVDWESPIGASILFSAHAGLTGGSLLDSKRRESSLAKPDAVGAEGPAKPEIATETAPVAEAPSDTSAARPDTAGAVRERGAFVPPGMGAVVNPVGAVKAKAGEVYEKVKGAVVASADAVRGDALLPIKRLGSKAYDILAKLSTAAETIENVPKVVAAEVGKDERIGPALVEGQLRGIEAQRFDEARQHLEKANAAREEQRQTIQDIDDTVEETKQKELDAATSEADRAKIKAGFVVEEVKRQRDDSIDHAKRERDMNVRIARDAIVEAKKAQKANPDDPTIEDHIAEQETAIEDARAKVDEVTKIADAEVEKAKRANVRVGYETANATDKARLTAEAKADRERRRMLATGGRGVDPDTGETIVTRRPMREIIADIGSGERENLKSLQAAAEVGTIDREDVTAFRETPEFKAAGEAWQRAFDKHVKPLYETLTNADPTIEKPGRDPVYGFRTNLKGIRPGEDATAPLSVRSRTIGGPSLKASPFARRATGTAEAYETNVEEQFRHSLQQTVPALRKRAIDTLVEEGHAKIAAKGVEKPEGWETFRFDKDYGVSLKGAESSQSKTVYMHPDAAKSVKAAFGTNPIEKPQGVFGWFRKAATGAAIMSGAEPIAHISNQASTTFFTEGLGGYKKWVTDARKFAKYPVEKAKAVARLADIGASRPEFVKDGPPSDFDKINPFKIVGRGIHDLDLAARTIVLDHVEGQIARGEVPDTLAARREAVLKGVGNYNVLAQEYSTRLAKAWTGDFIVAGRAFMGNAFRHLTLSDGTNPSTLKGQAKMRGVVAGRIASYLAVVNLWNYLKTDEWMPVEPWRIVTGKEDGRWTSTGGPGAALGITQLFTRTGADKVFDGLRSGAGVGRITADVANSIARRFLSTAIGPGVSTIAKGTGFQWGDYGPEFKMSGEKAKDALLEMNSLVSAFVRAYNGDDSADDALFGSGFTDRRSKSKADVETQEDRRDHAEAWDDADGLLPKMLKQSASKRQEWLNKYVEEKDWPADVKAKAIRKTMKSYMRWLGRGDD